MSLDPSHMDSLFQEQFFTFYFEAIEAELHPAFVNNVIQHMQSAKQDVFCYFKILSFDKCHLVGSVIVCIG